MGDVYTLKLVAGCYPDYHTPIHAVALACPGVDYTRLWPLPVERPWEDPTDRSGPGWYVMINQEAQMPRQFLEEYFSDEEFREMVEKLNGLNPSVFPWKWTTARKEHEDLFGETIRNGEVYFKREIGVGWGDAIKLSRLSMERMLYALFSANPGLEGLAEEICEARLKELQETYRRYSPANALFRGEEEEDAE